VEEEGEASHSAAEVRCWEGEGVVKQSCRGLRAGQAGQAVAAGIGRSIAGTERRSCTPVSMGVSRPGMGETYFSYPPQAA
jgi:hypothetical protein